MTTTNVSSCYHNLKLAKNHHTKPHMHVNLAGTYSPDYHLEWHQQVICSRKGLTKSSKTYILTVGYDSDGRDHDKTIMWVMQTCQWENLKLNKNKCHFRHSRIPFFQWIIYRDRLQPDPWKLYVLTEMPPHNNNKKRIGNILDNMDYLRKFLPSTVAVCKSLQMLTPLKCEWTWNLYERAKPVIKKNTTMAFNNKREQLYLERDA